MAKFDEYELPPEWKHTMETEARDYIDGSSESTYLPFLLDGMSSFVDQCKDVLNQ